MSSNQVCKSDIIYLTNKIMLFPVNIIDVSMKSINLLAKVVLPAKLLHNLTRNQKLRTC